MSAQNQAKKAAIGGLFGTAMEWYDFYLYGTASALIFPKLFFPGSDPYVGMLSSFATFFIGFIARPVGAAIFGTFGDRIGRKKVMLTTLLLMGISSTLIGVMPTYDSVGVLAPFLLTVLRVLQGIGVGGDWGGSVSMSMEWGDKKKQGLMGSWTQIGVALGLISSTLMMSGLIQLTGTGFMTWGWRIPFLLSIVLTIIGLVLRLKVEESPEFAEMKNQNKIVRQPVLEVIKAHPKEIILSALVRLSEQAPFYIFITFVVSYATGTLKLDKGFVTNAVTIASVLSLFMVPLAGYLSDRFGRKKVYLFGVVLTFLFAFPYFGLLNSAVPSLVLLGIVLSLIPHDIQYGPQAALIAESFPANLRYSGASLGYQLASVIAGGPAPLIATYLLHTYKSSSAISIYIMAMAAISFIATLAMKRYTSAPVKVKVTNNKAM